MKNNWSIQLFLVFLILFLSSDLLAIQGPRRCLLLPINDNVEQALAHPVFVEIESFLVEKKWCSYRTNSDILNILKNYGQNLAHHLQNPEVLKTIAEKMKVGSLIKIDIKSSESKTIVNIKVVSENGIDLYYDDTITVLKNNPQLLVEAIKNSLSIFEKEIPYFGKVIGVLGAQILVEVPSTDFYSTSDKAQFLRSRGLKIHPKLKKIVDWNFEYLGEGEIYTLSDRQYLVRCKESVSKLIKIDDWVKFDKNQNARSDDKIEENQNENYGRLGTLNLYGLIGKSETNNYFQSGTHSISGLTYGVGGRAETYLTRNIWISGELRNQLANLQSSASSSTPIENSTSMLLFKTLLGYRYLPLGFFYGPYIDGYAGYSSYRYDQETQTNYGFVTHKIHGITLGTSGSLPLQKIFRILMKFELLFRPGYSEDKNMYGEKRSSSGSLFEIGGQFEYKKDILLETSFELVSNKASFINDQYIKSKTLALKTGLLFYF